MNFSREGLGDLMAGRRWSPAEGGDGAEGSGVDAGPVSSHRADLPGQVKAVAGAA